MSSQKRKVAIQALLRRGQLKQLSIDLDMSYSYLSQAFSPSTAINFTDELARKVEKALGLEQGQLDQGVSIAVVKSPLPREISALLLDGSAARFQKHLADKRVETSVDLEIDGIKKAANLVIYNHDDSIYMIAMIDELSKKDSSLELIEYLILLMAISGAEYGVKYGIGSGVNQHENEYGYSRDHQSSYWYRALNGKIIRVKDGPDGFFENTGI